MAVAWRTAPDTRRAALRMLECAHHLAHDGILAPVGRIIDHAPAGGILSVIVCSIRPERLARLNWKT